MNLLSVRRRRQSGEVISWWLILILLLMGIAFLLYMLFHLLRIPPRQLPAELAPQEYQQYVYELLTNSGVEVIMAPLHNVPAGMMIKQGATILASTNLVDWEPVALEATDYGTFTTPDGAVLVFDGQWDEEAQQTTNIKPVVVHPGSNPVSFYKMPLQ